MRRSVVLVALSLAGPLAGCMSGPSDAPAATPSADSAFEVLDLQCVGNGGAVPSFEGAGSGRCWHHMGHHIYFVPEPRALYGLNGSVGVAEATLSQVQEYTVLVDVSLDGRGWTTVLRHVYAPDEDDRNSLLVAGEANGIPFRFLRVHVSVSDLEGLGGYLDYSAFALLTSATATVAPEPAQRTDYSCEDGVLESFFPEHPCWFGGYDPTDGGAPDQAHVAFGPGTSYYDSPSFVHTYYLGTGPGGALTASVQTAGWRTSQLALCARSINGANVPVQVLVVAQVSHDGRVWADIARDYRIEGEDDSAIITGTVPADTRFVRFWTGQGVGDEEGACYHSHVFLTSSGFTLAPPEA